VIASGIGFRPRQDKIRAHMLTDNNVGIELEELQMALPEIVSTSA
jgi:hypothetical protein